MSTPLHNNQSPRRSLLVKQSDDQRPLGDFLARACPEAPVGFLNRLIGKGLVLIDGEAATRKTRLHSGQKVALYLPEGSYLVAPNSEVPFDLIHEDSDLLIVAKPAGIVSEPGIGHKLDTLLNGLVSRYGEELDCMGPEHDFGMVHRLDRAASGLLAVTRNTAAYNALRKSFRGHAVEKHYMALVMGDLAQSSGEIGIPLGRVRRGGHAIALVGGSGTRPAKTEYRVVERFGDCTLVDASPRTGRWRQLRLHFQAIGHPIAGDTDDGDAAFNEKMLEDVGLSRLFLHAARLAFAHPVSGEHVAFSAPLPAELEAVLSCLRARSAD